MTHPVWKDVDEAKIKWPKPTKTHRPRTTEELIDEAHQMFKDNTLDDSFKAGFYYGVIQILEAERQATA